MGYTMEEARETGEAICRRTWDGDCLRAVEHTADIDAGKWDREMGRRRLAVDGR